MTPASPQPDTRFLGFGRTFDLAAFFVLALIFGIATWKMSAFFHDDALISLRYARNLALHNELTWNLGEVAEGYTNLLHVLLSAALIRVGFDPMLAAQTINWAAFAVLVPLSWALTSGFGLHNGARAAAMTAVISLPVICWIYGGLEPVLVAALTAAAYLCAKPVFMGKDRIALTLLASAFFACAYLTRPDTLVANFALGLAILAFAPLSLPRRFVHFIAIGAISALVLGAHIAVRMDVYGEVLPLTFYAKVGVDTATRLSNGIGYLGSNLILLPTLWFVLLGLLAARKAPASARHLIHAAALVCTLVVAYVAWSGGDHMPNARILVPLTPLLVLATACTLSVFKPNLRVAASAVLLVLAVSVAVIRPVEYADPAAAFGAIMGKHLDDNEPQDLLIAVATAGSTPYFATRHTFIDTLGLNDPHIAKSDATKVYAEAMTIPGHAKGDASYVLARQPDLIIFGTATGLPSEIPIFRSDFQLNELPEFARCYALETYDPPEEAVAGLWSPQFNERDIILFVYRRTCPKT